MKPVPSFFCLSLLLGSLMVAHAADYTVNSTAAGNVKLWNTPATWVGSPVTYPNSKADNITFPAHTNGRQLLIELDVVVGSFKVTGTAAGLAQQYLMAAENKTVSIEMDSFSNESSTLFHIANDAGKLSVTTGSFSIVSGATVSIGTSSRNGIRNFDVTGESSIEGILRFAGIDSNEAGKKEISLGNLTMGSTGHIFLGYSGNSDTKVKLTGLNGSGFITLTTSDTSHQGKVSTLEITNAASTVSTYGGLIRTSNSSNPTYVDDTFRLSLVKKGEGTQILSNNGNDYRGGTLIESGTLAVTNTSGSGLGLGKVTVQDGATLAGSGFLRLKESVTVEEGGNLFASAHLTNQVTTLTLSGVNLESGSILSMEKDSSFTFRFTAEGGSDLIAFTNYSSGGFLMDGDGIVINATGVLKTGLHTLFSFDNIETAELIALSSLLRVGDGFSGYNVSFDYDETGIVTHIHAIPEPTVAALGALGLLAFCLRRYRK